MSDMIRELLSNDVESIKKLVVTLQAFQGKMVATMEKDNSYAPNDKEVIGDIICQMQKAIDSCRDDILKAMQCPTYCGQGLPVSLDAMKQSAMVVYSNLSDVLEMVDYAVKVAEISNPPDCITIIINEKIGSVIDLLRNEFVHCLEKTDRNLTTRPGNVVC